MFSVPKYSSTTLTHKDNTSVTTVFKPRYSYYCPSLKGLSRILAQLAMPTSVLAMQTRFESPLQQQMAR